MSIITRDTLTICQVKCVSKSLAIALSPNPFPIWQNVHFTHTGNLCGPYGTMHHIMSSFFRSSLYSVCIHCIRARNTANTLSQPIIRYRSVLIAGVIVWLVTLCMALCCCWALRCVHLSLSLSFSAGIWWPIPPHR